MKIPNYTQAPDSKVCNTVSMMAVIDGHKGIDRTGKAKFKDMTERARQLELKHAKGTPWAGFLNYDLAKYAKKKGFNVTVFRREHKVPVDPSPKKDITSYFHKVRREALASGVKEVITERLEKEVFELLKRGKPVLIMVNGDKLYSNYSRQNQQWWAHWVVAKDYDPKTDTVVLHDPAGWTVFSSPNIDLEKVNEIKKITKGHYIRLDRKQFLRAWRSGADVIARDIENELNKKTTKPFTQEAILITP